jgi:hypothetical protein
LLATLLPGLALLLRILLAGLLLVLLAASLIAVLIVGHGISSGFFRKGVNRRHEISFRRDETKRCLRTC